MIVASGVLYAMRERHVIICSASGFTIFFHFILQMTQSLKKIIDSKMCALFSLQLLSETFLIPRRTERDMMKNVCWFSCKVTVIIVRFE